MSEVDSATLERAVEVSIFGLLSELPLVIVNPDADFGHLPQTRSENQLSAAQRVLSDRDIRTPRPSSPDPDALPMRTASGSRPA